MKNLTKKLALLLLSVIMSGVVLFPQTAFAAEKTMTITLRIEGLKDNIFYDTQEIPYTDSLTLQKALSYIDEKEKSIELKGVDTAYITDVNGEAAGQFGGYDGWLYTVNGEVPSVGIDSLKLSDGDSIVLYYGDPFGVGMQYPVTDTSDIEEGILRFTSSDTTYDANYNATVTVNPVAGATVLWYNNDKSTKYVTDENGAITIDKDQLTSGTHKIQISKTNDAGIPLVLRFAPDYAATISSDDQTSQSNTDIVNNTDSDSVNNNSENDAISMNAEVVNEVPQTGESLVIVYVFGALALVSLAGVVYFKKKSNEK